MKLNECTIGGKWPITAAVNSSASNDQGQSSMKLTIGDDGKGGLCLGLTPSFSTLGANFQ